MKKIKEASTQNWIPIEEILENGVIKTKNKYIKILKITPINYNLKSDLEKQAILNSKENLEKNILKIQKNIQKKENKYLKSISENYIEYIYKINSNKKSASKNFYLIISKNNSKQNYEENIEMIKNDLREKYFKIKECLSRCGNSVYEINTKEEILKIINSFLNTRKEINQKNIEKEEK